MLLALLACTENQVVPRESQPSTHDSEVEDSPADSPVDSPVDSEAPVLEPDIVLTPRSYGWASLADVCPAQDKSLVVYNDGDADLLLLEVEVSEPFSVTVGDAELAPGDSTTLEVSFSPERWVSYEAELRVESNDPDEPEILVSLSGSGEHDCRFDSVWFTNGNATLLQVDRVDNSLVSTTALPSVANRGVAVDSDHVWLCATDSLLRVAKADLSVEEIELGGTQLAIALDDEEVFVASNDDQTLYVLDKTGSVIETTSLIDVQVLDLDLDEDHIYAALFDLGSSYPYEGRVAVLDRSTLEETDSLTFEGYPDVYTGNTTMAHYPQAVHVEEGTLWVAVTNEDLLFQVDLSTLGVVATHPASSRPKSLASDRDHVYLANKHGASLYQFDAGGLVDSTAMDQYLTSVAADDEQLWVVRQQGGVARLESDGLGMVDDFGHYGQSWSSDVHISGDTIGFEYLNRHLRD
jgi:hypothetical protein